METQANFLEVPKLLEQSLPGRGVWFVGYALGLFLLVLLASAYVAAAYPKWGNAANLGSAFVTLLIVVGLVGLTVRAARRNRAEQARLEGIDELIQLRRWQEAAGVLEQFLSFPTASHAGRIQGLIYLSMVLTRYHRFDEAIDASNYVLEHVQLDPVTEYTVKLSRAMAMLRLDHLVDADQAISELRRMGEGESGSLSLIEIYRDVKTGHPEEAVDLFSKRLTSMRQQLGHRVGDAYALAGKAMRMLGRLDDARRFWTDATILISAEELIRRYPELDGMNAN